MKLGELFVQLTTKGDTKELDKTLKQLETAHKQNVIDLKTKKELAKATTEEEKSLIQKNAQNEKDILNTKNAITAQRTHVTALRGTVMAFTALVAGATIAYNAINRMVNALADANQKIINFNRQTGISLGTLNKYASASVAVNRNATIEGTAQSLQNVASNLFDIQMGRGDISPYQELAFVGGKAFNPANMSVEQVIENVREAIKGVGDIQATNIITRMGFNPDDLMMLRMSREEFDKIQGLFLDPASREALNQYGLQLRIIGLRFQLFRDRALLKIMPIFIKFSRELYRQTLFWTDLAKSIFNCNFQANAIGNTLNDVAKVLKVIGLMIGAIMSPLTALFLFIEDVVGYSIGWDSYIGEFIEALPEVINKIKEAIGGWADIDKTFEDWENKGWWGKIGALTKAQGLSGLPGNATANEAYIRQIEKMSEQADLRNKEILKTIQDTLFKIFSSITGNRISLGYNAILPSVNNGGNTIAMTQNNEFNINGGANVQQQVTDGVREANRGIFPREDNRMAYNAVIAQNGIIL